MEQKEKAKNFGVILKAIIIAIVVVLIGYSIIRIIKSGPVQVLII